MGLHLVITAAIAVVVLVYLYSWLKGYIALKQQLSGFQQPNGWPLVGSIHRIIGSPEQVFKNIRKVIGENGTCFIFWLGTIPTFCISSPEDCETVLSSMKHHRKGFMYRLLHCWLGTGLLTSQGSKWRNRRKLLTPSFHFSILQQFLDTFNEHTSKLVQDLKDTDAKKGTDAVPHITKYTLNTICETAMGTPLNDSDHQSQKEYMKNVNAMGNIIRDRIIYPWFVLDPIFAMVPLYWKMKKICQNLHAFSTKIIYHREKEFNNVDMRAFEDNDTFGKDDGLTSKTKLAMLDILLSHKHQQASIDYEGIREEVDTFIFEGHDTTGMNMSLMLMLLACNKRVQEKIVEEFTEVLGEGDKHPTYNELQELKYMERCIKESLRLYPSVPMITRYSDGLHTSKGLWVPKDIDILVLIYDMHRNPKYYPGPEKFDPDRFLPENIAQRHPFAYIPFSAGPRNCIGQKLAMMEMKVMLLAILRNFILEPVDTPDSIELITHLIIKPKDGVRVKFVPRTHKMNGL